MPEITEDTIVYFEKKIYLPMLIKVLQMDLELFHKFPVKLNRPYIAKIENTLQTIKHDIKRTDIYMTRNSMKLVRNHYDKMVSNYLFMNRGVEVRKEYTNAELQENCEEVLVKYFTS